MNTHCDGEKVNEGDNCSDLPGNIIISNVPLGSNGISDEQIKLWIQSLPEGIVVEDYEIIGTGGRSSLIVRSRIVGDVDWLGFNKSFEVFCLKMMAGAKKPKISVPEKFLKVWRSLIRKVFCAS